MYRSSLLIVLTALSICVNAQFPYAQSNLPDSLKNNAAVIYHLENYDMTVDDIDHYTVDVHKVYTVINDDGKNELFFREYITKYRTINDVEIKVYNGYGKLTAKFKKKDLLTHSIGDGLVEDGAMMYYPLPGESFPVTVDVSYVVRCKTTFILPDFRFVQSKQSVVEANFNAKVLSEVGLRYKATNFSAEPAITEDGKYTLYKWKVRNVTAVNYEEDGMADVDRSPHVVLAPARFDIYGSKGDLTSWSSFGQWLKDLYTGLDALPAERAEFFKQLVSGAPDDREKTRRIYHYLQNNFRYVSIQLGIGGWKPFPADFTDKKKYGDCKGLSNYMKAALKSVGIPSCLAFINAGYNSEPVDRNFPDNQFNHVILCVPGKNDSIWLECTSSTAAFGELGTATENRVALLVNENGGVLVSTPKSTAAGNKLSILTRTNLRDDLSGLMISSFDGSGAYGQMLMYLHQLKKDEQKSALLSYFGTKQPDDFELIKMDSSGKTELKMLMAKVPDFAAGNKLFITPRVYRLWPVKLPKAENRTSDYYFAYPYEQSDTTIISLPDGIIPDVLPTAKKLNCAYGDYQSNYWFNDKDRSVYVTTTLVLNSHKIPAEGYASVKKFFDDIAQEAAQKVIVIKKEQEKKGF